MQQLILAFTPIDTNSLFALALQAPCILRFVERPIRHNAVDLVDELRSELLTQVSTHKFEGEEICSGSSAPSECVDPSFLGASFSHHALWSTPPSIWEEVIASS